MHTTQFVEEKDLQSKQACSPCWPASNPKIPAIMYLPTLLPIHNPYILNPKPPAQEISRACHRHSQRQQEKCRFDTVVSTLEQQRSNLLRHLAVTIRVECDKHSNSIITRHAHFQMAQKGNKLINVDVSRSANITSHSPFTHLSRRALIAMI